MGILRWSKLSIVFVAVIAGNGCRAERAESRIVQGVFLRHGFVFVWEAKPDEDGGGDFLKQPHAVNKQPPPNVIVTGVAYVFHPQERQNMEHLGEHSIPAWIKESGCEVVSAPSIRDGGFFYPFLGGPTFDIRFRCGSRAYQIRALVDPYLMAAQKGKNSTALVLMRER